MVSAKRKECVLVRVLISAGGTGGHINPAIAIGKYIVSQDEKNEVLFIGSKGSLEEKLYKNSGLAYSLHISKGLDRKNLFNNIKILKEDYNAYREILKIAKKFKPDIGISCGGYISFMAMEAVKKVNAPFIITEQNAFPGLTTKLLSKDAKKYCLAFEEAKKFLKYPERAVVTGNPVRQEFSELKKEDARIKLGIPSDKKMILCFGGSLGAEKLNEAFFELIKRVEKESGIILYVGTGKRYYEDFIKNIKYTNNNIIIKEYIEDMPTVLMACDVAVTRAGAMTVSELCAAKKPCILIPSPNVTADHQTKNARVISDKSGGILIKESELSSEKFSDELLKLIKDDGRLTEMGENLSSLCVLDGAERIYLSLKEVLS